MTKTTYLTSSLSVIALSSIATLCTLLLTNQLTGNAPIYFQGGVIVATAIAFGWRGMLLALAFSTFVNSGFQGASFSRASEIVPQALNFLAFGVLGGLGLMLRIRFGARKDLAKTAQPWGVIGLVLVASLLSAMFLVLSANSAATPSVTAQLREFATLVFALWAGVLLTARISLVLFTSDWELLKESRKALLAGTIGLLIALWFNAQEEAASDAAIKRHVAEHTQVLGRALSERTIAHGEVLQSLARLIEFSPDLTQEAFDRFVALTLEEESDIFALSYNPIITQTKRAAFETKMQGLLGNPDFTIKERVNGAVQSSSEHALYVPVGIISPLASNAKAIGFDIHSNEVRRSAIESALARKQAAVTAPIKLVQETQERMAVLLLEPIWNGSLPAQQTDIVGFAVSVLKVDEMFKLNLQELLREGMNYRLSDAAINDQASDFVTLDGQSSIEQTYAGSIKVAVADRTWSLDVTPSREYLLASPVAPSQLSSAFVFVLAGLVKVLTQIGAVRNAEIKQRVQEQTQTIREQMDVANNALKELRERKEQQERLFAIIGHELRTPVSALKMMLDVHQGEHDTGPHSREIRSTVEHLLTVLDDMRYSIRPDEVQMLERTLAVPEHIIERTLNANAPQLSAAGIKVSLKNCGLMQQEFYFSEKVVRQILHNLLRNATLHSGASRLEICSTLEARTTGKTRLTVKLEDNGKGIGEQHLARLFEPFYRGNTEVDGTGLGLSICRQLARDHGGDLVYYNASLGGAGFRLTLDVDAADSSTVVKTADESEATLSKKANRMDGVRVLYAEDNPTIQLLTKTILTNLGASVSVAVNGKEALELAQNETFDLVVTDIFMPKLDGYGLTRTLREQGFTGCIVGVTAATVGEESDRLMDAGATAIIPKPLDVRKLLDVCDVASVIQARGTDTDDASENEIEV